MGFIKKKLRSSKADRDSKLHAKAKEFFTAIGRDWKIKERIAKANAYCDAHRRQTFWVTVGSLTAFLLLSLLFTFSGLMRPTGSKGMMSGVVDVSGTFSSISAAHSRQDRITAEIVSLGDRAHRLRHEADSIIRKPHKTHADSVEILYRVEQLRQIAAVLNIKETDN